MWEQLLIKAVLIAVIDIKTFPVLLKYIYYSAMGLRREAIQILFLKIIYFIINIAKYTLKITLAALKRHTHIYVHSYKNTRFASQSLQSKLYLKNIKFTSKTRRFSHS